MSDMEQSDVANDAASAEPVAPAVPEAPAPAVPVVVQQPSSAAASQQPEADPAPGRDTPLSLEDAARVLLILVKAHRTAGDSDVEAAIADVEAALPPAAA